MGSENRSASNSLSVGAAAARYRPDAADFCNVASSAPRRIDRRIREVFSPLDTFLNDHHPRPANGYARLLRQHGPALR
jgi:hypothetical protein